MRLIANLNELRCYAYLWAIAPGTSFYYIVHAELVSHLCHTLGRVPVLLSRRSRNHAQLVGVVAAKLSDELFCHPFGEVVL